MIIIDMSLKIDKKYLFALYSNIALSNACTYANINSDKKVQAKVLEDHFKLNKIWEALINRWYKKKYIEEKNKCQNINKIIAKYIRLIRNFYSHSTNYEENKDKLETFEETSEYFLKLIFQKIFKINTFLKISIKRLIFICLFLNNSEQNDLIWDLKNKIKKENNLEQNISFIEKNHAIKKYTFKIKKIKTHDSIHCSVVNYVNNFDETKQIKNSFINMSIRLLKYKYNEELNFEKNKFLIDCIVNNNESKITVNFQGLKYLLFTKHENFVGLIKKLTAKPNEDLWNFHKTQNNSCTPEENFNSFKKRFSDNSNIQIRHLLKTFNRVQWLLNKEDNNSDKHFILNQIHFELLFQEIHLDNDYISYEKNLKDELSELFKIDKSYNMNSQEWVIKIKTYILDKINTLQKFKNLYKRTCLKVPKSEDKQTRKTVIYTLWNNLKTNDKNDSYELLFKSLKWEKNSIQWNKEKKYLIPILFFYMQIFSEKKEENHISNLNKPEYKYIFKHRFPSSKNEIKIFYPDQEKEPLLFKGFESKNFHETINSKLFWEFIKLKSIKELNKDEFSKIIRKIKKYRLQELDVVKKVYSYDAKEDSNKKRRDYIFHRSISKFKEEKKIWDFLKNNKNISTKWISK